jgi:hypothetical protein
MTLGFLTLLACGTLSSVCATPQIGSPEASNRNRDAVLAYVLPVIYSSGKAVRLYYRSDCRAATNPATAAIPFPFVKVQSPSKAKTGLDVVRSIFEKDKNVTVTEDSKGIIRIRIGDVPSTILQTKLTKLPLNPSAQYNPDDTFNLIINTKEVQEAMRLHGFGPVWNPSSTRAEPNDTLPHLSTTIHDMTVEEILDEIAQTWAGQLLVIYGACGDSKGSGGPRQFWLGVAGQY